MFYFFYIETTISRSPSQQPQTTNHKPQTDDLPQENYTNSHNHIRLFMAHTHEHIAKHIQAPRAAILARGCGCSITQRQNSTHVNIDPWSVHLGMFLSSVFPNEASLHNPISLPWKFGAVLRLCLFHWSQNPKIFLHFCLYRLEFHKLFEYKMKNFLRACSNM